MAYGYQGASRHHCQMASTPSDLYLTPNYRFTLRISKDFSHAQRSGHLPFNQCVKWHGHSGLTDGLDQGVDLVGGYYDAGDHVKFGLPMAYTITLLSWSVTEYEKDIKAINEFEHALEAIKWGLITLLKLIHVLWVQVGDGSSDHYCWQRPEDMTTRRRSFKIDKNNPGSEVAAETAAALASTSIAFNILIYEST